VLSLNLHCHRVRDYLPNAPIPPAVDTEPCRRLHIEHFAAQDRLSDDELFHPETGFNHTTAWDDTYDRVCHKAAIVELAKDVELRTAELRCLSHTHAPQLSHI
jgi:hypothetical protein